MKQLFGQKICFKEKFGILRSDRIRGSGHKLKHRFPLNVRKHFFTVRGTEHRPRLPREAVESPSLETDLGNQPRVVLLEQGAWARGPPEVSSNLNRSVIWEKGQTSIEGIYFDKKFCPV